MKNEKMEYIAHIKTNKDYFDVDFKQDDKKKNLKLDTHRKSEDKPWLIIRYTFGKDGGYRLKEGDHIKFGKVLFKVREIKATKDENDLADSGRFNNFNEYNRTLENYENVNIANIVNKPKTEAVTDLLNKKDENEIINTENNLLKINKKKASVPICRICLCDDYELDNPLINPCKCSGTMKYIHLNCLRLCFKSKIQTKTFNFLTAHCYKIFECDLCKKTIPERIKVNNMIFSLIELQRPSNNYIVLESICDKNDNKFLYIIHMKEKNIVRLGRASEADVRITDISVSRNHAELRLEGEHFYISDNSSKFGTLVQINQKIIVLPYSQVAVQLRKNFLILRMMKSMFAFLTCYNPKNLKYKTYNEYFSSCSIFEEGAENLNLNMTESVCRYDSKRSEIEDRSMEPSNLEINNNLNDEIENRQNITEEDEDTINNNENEDNNNEYNNINTNFNNIVGNINNSAQSPNPRPSIRLSININLQNVQNGNNNLVPIVESSPRNIDLNLKMTDVKNLVDNIFQIPGIREQSFKINENSQGDSPENNYFVKNDDVLILNLKRNSKIVKSDSNKNFNNRKNSQGNKNEDEEQSSPRLERNKQKHLSLLQSKEVNKSRDSKTSKK